MIKPHCRKDIHIYTPLSKAFSLARSLYILYSLSPFHLMLLSPWSKVIKQNRVPHVLLYTATQRGDMTDVFVTSAVVLKYRSESSL